MPFIGKPPAVGAYSVLDALTASATANYSLQLNGAAFVPNSVNQLLVSLNGVIQKPGSSFVVSGSTLTFKNGGSDQALTSSDSIDFIISMGGDPLNVGVVSDGTISNSKITDMAASKLTGALPALDGSALTGTGKMIAIANNTSGGSGSALEFDLSMDTSYLYQRFVIEGVWGAASNDIYFQSRRASDNTYFTGNGSYAWTAHGYGASSHGGNSDSSDTKGRIVYHGAGNANTEKSKFIFDIYDCHVSGRQTHFMGSRTGWMSSPGITQEFFLVKELATTTTNRFKIYLSGGGTIYYDGYIHYGFKRT